MAKKQFNAIKCDYCSKIFNKRKSYIKPHNFCCRKCYNNYQSKFLVGKDNKNHKDKNIYLCNHCGKEILMHDSVAKYKKFKFCNKECKSYFESILHSGSGNPNYKNGNIKINCLYCKKDFELPYCQKDRAKYCSKQCKNKYLSEIKSKIPDFRNKLVQNGIKSKKMQKNKFTKPEKIVLDYLNQNKINNIPQYKIDKFLVDFYLPERNIVIEVLGDYWHGNPSKYPNFTDKQKEKHGKDQIRKESLCANGYHVFMLWEDDIYKKLDEIMNFLN